MKQRNDLIPKLPKGSYVLDRENFRVLIRKYRKPTRVLLWKQRRVFKKALKGVREKMAKTGKVYTLSILQKMQVIEMSSKYYTPTQILNIIRDEWGHANYRVTALNELLRNNRELILRKREKYITTSKSLRLTHERARLEELQEIYYEAKDEDNKKIQIETLKEIRSEVKGDKLTLDGNLSADITLNVKQNLLTSIDSQSIVQLALLKLLSKHNINYIPFLHRLKVDNNVIDPQTQQVIPGRRLPVKLEDKQFLLSDKHVETMEQINEKKIPDNAEDVKERLKRALMKRKKQIDEVAKASDKMPLNEEPEERKKKKK